MARALPQAHSLGLTQSTGRGLVRADLDLPSRSPSAALKLKGRRGLEPWVLPGEYVTDRERGQVPGSLPIRAQTGPDCPLRTFQAVRWTSRSSEQNAQGPLGPDRLLSRLANTTIPSPTDMPRTFLNTRNLMVPQNTLPSAKAHRRVLFALTHHGP